jgi:predicted nucleic acid-binding protein
MAIVIDANLLIVMVNNDSRREQVLTQFRQWLESEMPIQAPALLPYEFANALTRSIVAQQFQSDDLAPAFEFMAQLPITYHPLTLNSRVVEIALSLGRQNAYDAAYLALAELLNAQFWTLDRPLCRNAQSLGFPVCYLLDS